MNIYRHVPARNNFFSYCNVFLFPNSKSGRSNTEAYLLWPAYNVRCDLGNLLGWGRVSSAEQWGQGRRTEEQDCSALCEQQTERSSCWERFKAACLFCIFIPCVYFYRFLLDLHLKTIICFFLTAQRDFCPFCNCCHKSDLGKGSWKQ